MKSWFASKGAYPWTYILPMVEGQKKTAVAQVFRNEKGLEIISGDVKDHKGEQCWENLTDGMVGGVSWQ
jgi:hypothetical protein